MRNLIALIAEVDHKLLRKTKVLINKRPLKHTLNTYRLRNF